jgi:cobaltochelatase CobN
MKKNKIFNENELAIAVLIAVATVILFIPAVASENTTAWDNNEMLFILGTDTNEAALKNAAANPDISDEVNITIFTRNDTVPQNLNFSNYSAIFIESQNEMMIAKWNASIIAAMQNSGRSHIYNGQPNNGSVVIGYNLSASNASISNVDLRSANYTDIERYWIQGGEENLKNVVISIMKNFFGKWVENDLPQPVVIHPVVNITYIINSDSNRFHFNRFVAGRSVITDRFNVTVMSGAAAVNANLSDLSDQDVIMLYMIGANELPHIKDVLFNAKQGGTQIGLIATNDMYGIGTIDMENPPHNLMKDYNYNGGYANMENWIRCIGATLCSVYIEYAPAAPPLIPQQGIYHPDAFPRIFTNSTEYIEWYTNKDGYQYNASAPTIGIVRNKFDDNRIFYKTGDAIINELESRGCNVIYTTSHVCREDIDYFTRDGSVLVDTIISLNSFYFNYYDQEKGVDYLKKFNVPVLKGLTDHYNTPAEFNNSSRGLDPMSIPFQVSMPEIDGCIDYIWVAGRVIDPEDPDLTYNVPIIPQVEWLCDRTVKWANLGRVNNTDKKVAIIYYNHEGGKNNIGASYLDISPSFTLLLEQMQTESYFIGSSQIPNGSEFINLFMESRNVGSWAPGALQEMVESGKARLIPADQYLTWYNSLPETVRFEVEATWGKPPGNIMVYEGSFVMPVVEFGNIIFMPQPTRGWLSDESLIYHDKEIPPTHQYLAAYFWINNIFDADAIIHFGTHSSQEWLPGNEVGLWRYDFPSIMVNDTPIIYPYIMDNVGEGTQAKRRGNAVIIDHLTPPIVTGGLYDDLLELHDKIHAYKDTKNDTNPALKASYRNSTIELYESLGLCDDLNVTAEQMRNMNRTEFEDFLIVRVHDYLHELQSTLMPLGLHIFGVAPEDEKLVCMVKSMLRQDFIDHIVQVILPDSGDLHDRQDMADKYALDLLNTTLLNETDISTAQIDILNLSEPDTAITADLNQALNYSDLLSQTEREIDQALRALNAEYIEPGPGNDPIRNPEALPTGRNFYSFDQRKIPDAETEAIGAIMADQLLKQYQDSHDGVYPNKVGFILWSIETMRHKGVMEAQIHSLLGVKPIRNSGRITGFEVIPLDNMSHPRIDVLIISSGLYRDTFPYQLELIDEAVRMIAELDESNETNYVRYNSIRIYDALITAGYDNATAFNLSRSRIFSVPPGAYGTGLEGAITASESWDDESKLADLFTSRMSNIYGQDIWGDNFEDVLKLNLGTVDAAVHSDSSNLFGVIDNDDYYQWLGGLALAVRSLRGENPDLFITDLENIDNPTVITLEESFRKELRSRYWNPKWIEGMMEHDYGGAREFMKFVEYMWGWNVVTPDMVTDGDWDRIFDVYVNDKYNLDLDEFFKGEPYAYQSMVARMLEVNRKVDANGDPYWDADEETINTLAREYVESVVENGATCCHHTCGNPLLDEHIQGLISVPGMVSEEIADKYRKIMEEVKNRETPADTTVTEEKNSNWRRYQDKQSGSGNETIDAKSGFGTNVDQAPEAAEGGEGESKKESDYVEGYEMQDEVKPVSEDTGSFSFSGSDIMGLMIVILIVGAIYIGYKRKS